MVGLTIQLLGGFIPECIGGVSYLPSHFPALLGKHMAPFPTEIAAGLKFLFTSSAGCRLEKTRVQKRKR